MDVKGGCKAVGAALTAWYDQGHVIGRYLWSPVAERLTGLRDRLSSETRYSEVERAYKRLESAEAQDVPQRKLEAQVKVSEFLGNWDGNYGSGGYGSSAAMPREYVPISSHEPFRKLAYVEPWPGFKRALSVQ